MRILRPAIRAVLMAGALAAAGALWPPTAAHAAPARQNGFIAFGAGNASHWNVIDADGSNLRTVTPYGTYFDPASMTIQTVSYSPDARRVAFITWGSTDPPALWVAEPDGANARRIASVYSKRVAWSPDSSTVYFGSGSIQAMPADGSRGAVTVVPDANCSDTAPQVTSRGTQKSVFVGAVGAGEAAGTKVADLTGQGTYGMVGFAPSGDVLFADQRLWSLGPERIAYTLKTGPDSPNAHPGDLYTGIEFGGAWLKFMDWVNGPSNVGDRPVADRVGGADRTDTALKASQWSFDGAGRGGRRAAVAVPARADTFPDALAGTALAVQAGGPLLLTSSNGLDPSIGTELRRILAPGSTVYLLGGSAALAPSVADAVSTLGFVPTRLGGTDRYATAATIAGAIAGSHPRSVLLATGTDFPDALTAGVAAGQERYSLRGGNTVGGGVVLLTDGTAMPAATRAYLGSLGGDTTVYAVGGPAVRALDSAFPHWPRVTRLVGADRYATAAAVASSALYGAGAPGRYTMAGIATGLNFPDALSGGALVGAQGGPLLLADADGLTPAENRILTDGHLSGIVVTGGVKAVSDPTLTAAADTAFGAQAWDTFTNHAAPPLK